MLFILQAALIVFLSRILAFFLGRLRQPRVISEVIAGIIIGPTAFGEQARTLARAQGADHSLSITLGRIPHFTAHIFPPASLPYLNLVRYLRLDRKSVV